MQISSLFTRSLAKLARSDFNVDVDRPSRNLSLFFQFIIDESLIKVPFIDNDMYTFESHTGSRSKLDYFLVKQIVFNNSVQKVKSIDEGDNLSQHLPIYYETQVAMEHFRESNKRGIIDINWDKATSEQIQTYHTLVENHLGDISIEQLEFAHCNVMNCKEHDISIMQFLDRLSNILNHCAKSALPSKRIGGKTPCPGWGELVAEHRDKALFWHQVWVSAGRPVSGQLADLRRSTRRKYHWAVRKAKNQRDKLITSKTASSLSNKSFKVFWDEIKLLNKGAVNSVNVIDGAKGSKEIAQKFQNIYEGLYNSIDDKEITKLHINVQKVNIDLLCSRQL